MAMRKALGCLPPGRAPLGLPAVSGHRGPSASIPPPSGAGRWASLRPHRAASQGLCVARPSGHPGPLAGGGLRSPVPSTWHQGQDQPCLTRSQAEALLFCAARFRAALPLRSIHMLWEQFMPPLFSSFLSFLPLSPSQPPPPHVSFFLPMPPGVPLE